MRTHQNDRVNLPRLRCKFFDYRSKGTPDHSQEPHLSKTLNHDEQGSKEDKRVPFDAVKCFFNVVVIVEQEYNDGTRNRNPNSCARIAKLISKF